MFVRHPRVQSVQPIGAVLSRPAKLNKFVTNVKTLKHGNIIHLCSRCNVCTCSNEHLHCDYAA